jgi:tetratricopeptide (TPR) repeat protein
VAVLEADIDNLRAATERLFADGDVEGVRAIAVALPMYWEMRGLYGEARRWLDRAAALEQPDDETRRRLLLSLARAAYAQGDHPAAVEASDEAARLSSRLAGALGPLDALRDRAFAAWDRADWDEAERAFRERLALATEVDNGVAMSACRLNLAAIANKTRRHDLAHALLAENLAFVRSRGQARCEANTMLGFADTAVSRGAAEDGIAEALEGARLSLGIRDGPTAIDCLERWAVGAATKGDVRGAATILAATEAARESMGAELDEDGAAIRAATLAAIEASTPDAAATIVATASSDGRSLDLAAALERAAESR